MKDSVKVSTLLGYLFIGCAVFLSIVVPVYSQQPEQRQLEQVEGYLSTPARLEFDESLVQQLQLPAGFEIDVFAKDLENPRNLAIGSDGTVYVTRRDQGDILALKDQNGDGKADTVNAVASDLEYINGITTYQNRLYFATDREVYAANLGRNGEVGRPETLIDDLPDAGQHPNRTVGVGPDQMLYISVGSTCNACDETNDESATLLKAQLDGRERTVYAEGLRNMAGFAWHPQTKELWGMDMGSDWRGDDQPPEELNLIQQDQHYGWPFCWGDRQPDVYIPSDPEDATKAEFCAKTTPPVLTYTAHSSPLDMVFYSADQFPAEYQNDAFVTLRGSWNRNPPAGYKVVRVRYQAGKPVEIADFITGFLTPDRQAQFGRPVGLVVAPDGSLLFTDDTNGVIYRVRYTG